MNRTLVREHSDANRSSPVRELIGGGDLWRLWLILGWDDARLRYKRSVLGPLWLTLSTGIMVTGIGLIWSFIWGMDIAQYFPYLAAGLVTWQFLLGAVLDGARTFSDQASLVRSLPLPLAFHSFRLCMRLLISYGHNLVVFVLVALVFSSPVGLATLAFIPGVALLWLNALWVSIVFGMIGARFRDVPAILDSVMGLLIFVTPIVWQKDMLGDRLFIATLNPLTHYLAIVRDPLLGLPVAAGSYLVVGGLTVAGWLWALVLLRRYRGRLAYWV